MVNITLSVDEDTHNRMKTLPEINFSEIARRGIKNYLLDTQIPDAKEEKVKEFVDYAWKLKRGIKFKGDKSEYKDTPSWLINLGLRALRLGNFEEASYCFDGVRCGTVKYVVNPTPFQDTLNVSLRVLRDFCSMMRGKLTYKVERLFKRANKEWLFYKDNVEYFDDPSEENYLRFDDKKFILNCLCFVTGFMFANVNLVPSRSEVDPFGTTMTASNLRWVVNISEKIISEPIDKNSDPFYLKPFELG